MFHMLLVRVNCVVISVARFVLEVRARTPMTAARSSSLARGGGGNASGAKVMVKFDSQRDGQIMVKCWSNDGQMAGRLPQGLIRGNLVSFQNLITNINTNALIVASTGVPRALERSLQ
jgi:hypothetical protein